MADDWKTTKKHEALASLQKARTELEQHLGQAQATEETRARRILLGVLEYNAGRLSGQLSSDWLTEQPTLVQDAIQYHNTLRMNTTNQLLDRSLHNVELTIRQANPELIENTPQAVIDQLPIWQGNQQIGWFILLAKHHAEQLLNLVDELYTRDIVVLIEELAGPGYDPTHDRKNLDLRQKWHDLPRIARAAQDTEQLLEWELKLINENESDLTSQDIPRLGEAWQEARATRRCLVETRLVWDRQREAALETRLPSDGNTVTLRGMRLFHKQVRQQLQQEERKASKANFVGIDIDTGAYALGESETKAYRRLKRQGLERICYFQRLDQPKHPA